MAMSQITGSGERWDAVSITYPHKRFETDNPLDQVLLVPERDSEVDQWSVVQTEDVNFC